MITAPVHKNQTRYCLCYQHCCQVCIETNRGTLESCQVYHALHHRYSSVWIAVCQGWIIRLHWILRLRLGRRYWWSKSMFWYLFRIGNATVSWGCKKQSCVALSTAEVEYMSLTLTAKEGIWLNRLLAELQIEKEVFKPVMIFEDNQSAICMSKNPQFHRQSKHIAVRYHFVRDETKKGTIQVKYCKT